MLICRTRGCGKIDGHGGACEIWREPIKPYTPTTEEVQALYKSHFDPAALQNHDGGAEFDRWLAEVERAAAEKALTDAAHAFAAASINVEIFNDPDERDARRRSNETRDALVASLRARAAALGLTAGQERESDE